MLQKTDKEIIGVIIITENKILSKTDTIDNTIYHQDLVEELLENNKLSPITETNWPKELLQRGYIVIEFIHNTESNLIYFVPDKINKYQEIELNNIKEEFNENNIKK